MVAGSRIGPELASAANAASISRAIVWRVSSAGFFSSISLAVGPIMSACCASSSGLPPMIVGWEDVLLVLGFLWRVPAGPTGEARANRLIELIMRGLGQ